MQEVFEEIIKKLEEQKSDLTSWAEDEAYKLAIDDSIKIVKLAAKQYNGGWVSVKDALPTEDGDYLTCNDCGMIDVDGFTLNAYKLDKYDFAKYKGKKKKLFYDFDSEYGYTEATAVTHWMPLPEKPNGE